MEVRMKAFSVTVPAAALTIFLAAPASAQQAVCHPISPTSRVVVTTTDGAKLRGTVVCLTDQNLMLLRDGVTRETSLSEIRRIDTRADPVWDGAVKGAAIPLIMWAVFCHDCDSEIWMKNVVAYGLIGATWDAVQRNNRTIYTGRPAASLAWRIRF
jgi:hypothetical protein